jgi:gliding motility-associated-like protein
MVSCNQKPVLIGAISKPGLTYSWSPDIGLSNPHIANPFATPDHTTTYYVSTRHEGGGCLSVDSVVVRASIINNSMELIGSAAFCADSGDSALLRLLPTDSIQWFRNNNLINGAHRTDYRVTQSGQYYAQLFNRDGCSITTLKEDIIIDQPTPGIMYPLQYAVIDMPLDLKARSFGNRATWSPGTWLNNRTSFTPVFTGSSDQLFTIEIKTAGGCTTIDTQLVKIVPHAEIYVPSAFTPKHDGRNDYLRPTLMGIREVHFFRVFNRWGELLYEMKPGQPGWDGTRNGKPQASQVVVWMTEGVSIDNRIIQRKGTALVVR